jgi:signal transduction histidine kinase
MDAQLIQNIARSARPRLVLRSGSVVFPANLHTSGSDNYFPPWKPGSVLRIRGVCSIQANDTHEPGGFKLLISSPRDVVLLARAPWWTLKHTLTLAGVFAVGIGIATGWIVLLRGQVKAQTDVIRKNHRELLDVSRQAGMAEVATSVLHNVGNVLTSVTVSSTLIGEKIKSSKAESLTKVVNLLRQHEGDLGEFLTSDAKGKRLVEFLQQLAGHLVNEQEDLHHEANHLQKNIEHIREIVSMQQKYAKIVAVEEPLKIADLVEDALSMNAAALERHQVQVLREYGTDLPEIVIDKNKILQILINLIQNAKYACSELRAAEKKLSIKVVQEGQRVKILVIDNGVGIPSENLNRIFNHGFTTRKEGHGFGLHSGALAAGELGGKLSVQSEGVGRGAVFTLELPLIRKN